MKLLLSSILIYSFVNAKTIEDIKIDHQVYGEEKAIKLYEELIKDKDLAQAKVELAKIFIKNKKRTLKYSYNLLIQAAKDKNAEAFYLLGKIHLAKKTSFFNKTKAFNYFVDSSNLNFPKAHNMLAKHYLFGIAVEVDYEKAMYFFKKASKQKDYASNCYISYMYASGKGVLANFGRAHVFAKDEYEKGNKLCVKVWEDYNLKNYPKDKSWKIGNYTKPIK